jgi:iron(III) transport system permease protein
MKRAVVVALLLLLGWLVLYPLVLLLAESFRDGSRWTWAHYAAVFASAADRSALVHTLVVAAGSVVGAFALGLPLAALVARRRFPGRRLLAALAAVPVVLPPLVGTLALVFVYGEQGLLARWLRAFTGAAAPPWRFQGVGAILLVHASTMYVYVYLLALAALARVDPRLEEAAATLGAGRWRRWLGVLLPQLRPALFAGALLVTLSALGSFTAPYLFGGNFRVVTTQIYASKLNGETGRMLAESALLAGVALGLLALLGRERAGPSGGSVGVALPGSGLRRAGWGTTAAVALGVAVPLLPQVLLVAAAFGLGVPGEGFTLAHFRRLVTEPERLVPVLNSLQFATAATLANLAVAVPAGYLLARGGPARSLLSLLTALPWAVPATVLAVALAVTFSLDAPSRGRLLLVGTVWILPLAYFVRNLPVVARAAAAAFAGLDPRLEEAAATLGAGRLRRWVTVVLPLVWPGIAAGAVLALVSALGEFVASILLYTPRSRPLSIELLARLRDYDLGGAAAYATLLLVLVAATFYLALDEVDPR